MESKNKVYEFEAVIHKHDRMDAAYILFPYDVEEAFGTRGQVKVKARFDAADYRGSLVKMGMERHCLGLTKAIRSAIGKKPGDTVHVALARDDEERVVQLPRDLAERLEANKEAKRFFEGLSYTHRKEYATWIESAKKSETREARLSKTVDMLLSGVKHP